MMSAAHPTLSVWHEKGHGLRHLLAKQLSNPSCSATPLSHLGLAGADDKGASEVVREAFIESQTRVFCTQHGQGVSIV